MIKDPKTERTGRQIGGRSMCIFSFRFLSKRKIYMFKHRKRRKWLRRTI